MGWLSLFGLNRLPEGVEGATLVVGNGAVLNVSSKLLGALQTKFGNVALAEAGSETYAGALPVLKLPERMEKAADVVRKSRPQRLVMLGMEGRFMSVADAAGCPVFWINVSDWEAAQTDSKVLMVADPQLHQVIPGAVVTGDPLVNLQALPSLDADMGICQRFKEQHEGNRWIGYFAATGESEEEEAYAIFNRLIRYKMGLMVLAPRDLARCEPVYRESIKYRLQTIRHNRLSTSFVPLKTRVYYIEEPEPLAGLYGCVNFVVAGGTMHAHAQNVPDLITPILRGVPVIVGSAHRDDPLVSAAVAAKVVLAAADSNEIFEHARYLLENPAEGARIAEHAIAWLNAQVGAQDRVLALIE